MKKRVLFPRKIPEKDLNVMRDKVESLLWEKKGSRKRRFFLREASVCDGLVVIPGDPIDREVLQAGKNLKVVSCYAVGYDTIDISAATDLGIL